MNWSANGLTNTAAASLNISTAQDGHAAINDAVNANVNPQTITLPVGSTQGTQATRNISATVNRNSNALRVLRSQHRFRSMTRLAKATR
ncbi:MAG: hypothetical protein QOE55_6056 [Acidobacteriaceae bacterium]|nr:hypothetical protein [Acidobacteriaceae bacterium]